MPDCYPERLEAGTLDFPAIVSLHEGVLYLKEHGVSDESALSKILHDELSFVTLYSKPNSYGIVDFSSEKMSSEEIAMRLSDEYDIAVRGGLHCAPLIHERIDRHEGGSVRVSLGYGNTLSEAEYFVSALRTILK